MNERDVELEQQYVAPAKGFQSVVTKITSDEDKTTTIFRRFDKLSARNLLFYQAELAELQALQDQYDEEDRKAVDDISRECQRDWTTFVAEARADLGADEARVRQKKKMELAMKIREVLERYHSALASHKELLNAVPPSSSTVRAFRNWFFDNTAGIKGGERTPQLWGASAQSYDDIHDLVALRVPADQDRLSEFIQNNFGIFFQTSTPDNRTTYISERKVSRFVAVLSTILAAILLLGAIIPFTSSRIRLHCWGCCRVGPSYLLLASDC